MAEDNGAGAVKSLFAASRSWHQDLLANLVDDPDAAMAEAAEHFEAMLPTMAYLDKPRHPMAAALFSCHVVLAVYLAARQRGVSAHALGGALLERATTRPMPELDTDDEDGSFAERWAAFAASAEASQADARPGEFVYEALLGDRDGFDWGMNVKSCAICDAFARHDAMDLVPYMCATDDVVSDRGGQGLRRTGSIALGAHQCDFRYQRGGTPQRLAEQYPRRIQVKAG